MLNGLLLRSVFKENPIRKRHALLICFVTVTLLNVAGKPMEMEITFSNSVNARYCDQRKKQQKQPSNDQSVKVTRLTSLSERQAFWLFEGRIGWGSCKLPNNLSAQHCTVLDITMFPVYLDHTATFDADPSPG